MALLNPFVMRKYAALIVPPMLSTVFFYVATVYYGLLWGIVGMLAGLLTGLPVGVLFLKNPFSMMLEGKGIMVLNLDSTGIIKPFISIVQSPYIRAKVNKKNIQDVFDRQTVYNLATPIEAGKAEFISEGENKGGLRFELDEETFNKARFGLYHYPVLIWNEQINSVITKDWLSDKESSTFAEHGVLYLNRTMMELTSSVRDFGRYIVEVLKPKQNILQNKWFWIILMGALILMGIMFAPAIIQALSKVSGTVNAAASTASAGVVTPRG